MQANKFILSACPFFTVILRRNPLLYLKGVKYQELLLVLNFMYQGTVNLPQEELNIFLAVAKNLRVKGLTLSKSDSTIDHALKQRATSPKLSDPAPLPGPRSKAI